MLVFFTALIFRSDLCTWFCHPLAREKWGTMHLKRSGALLDSWGCSAETSLFSNWIRKILAPQREMFFKLRKVFNIACAITYPLLETIHLETYLIVFVLCLFSKTTSKTMHPLRWLGPNPHPHLRRPKITVRRITATRGRRASSPATWLAPRPRVLLAQVWPPQLDPPITHHPSGWSVSLPKLPKLPISYVAFWFERYFMPLRAL